MTHPYEPGWTDRAPGYGGHSLAYDDGPSGSIPWRRKDERETQAVEAWLTPWMIGLAWYEAWLAEIRRATQEPRHD